MFIGSKVEVKTAFLGILELLSLLRPASLLAQDFDNDQNGADRGCSKKSCNKQLGYPLSQKSFHSSLPSVIRG